MSGGGSRRVVIVGGGAAGAAGAIAARRAGATATVVRGALGATACSSGAVDLAADPFEAPGQPWRGRRPGRDLLAEALRAAPAHPLALCRDGLDRALEVLLDELPLLARRPLDAPPLVLATELGTFKSTTLAPTSCDGGDLPGLEGARLGVVGVAGHAAGPDPGALAPRLEHLAARGGVRLEAVPVLVELLLERGDELAHPSALARRLEAERPLARFARDLAREVLAAGLTHLLLPPIVGLEDAARSLAVVRGAVGVPAFEMLAGPPSVPGLRLQAALDGALSRLGVPLVADRVLRFRCERGALRAAVLERGGELEGEAFVLATGKFIGGGLVARERIEEPLLGLPVFVDEDGPGPAHLGRTLSRRVEGPHALLRAGLRVDRHLRPLGAAGAPAHPNLFAAGSVLGGYDYISGRCGLGTALATGHAAGLHSASASGEVA
jgi:glycerol-3-phosphate dehydrogenase subunit B